MCPQCPASGISSRTCEIGTAAERVVIHAVTTLLSPDSTEAGQHHDIEGDKESLH